MLEASERQAWMKSRRQKRKVARHVRVRQQMLRYFLMVLLVGSGAFFLSHSPWSIQDLDKGVEVSGNNYLATSKVKNILSKYVDTPIFQIDPKKVEKEVEALESVKFAFVRRYVFPRPRVIIKVKEEFPWASLTSDPEKPIQYVIAESGRLVPVDKFPSYPKPKLLFSANVQKGKANHLFSDQEVKQWATWIKYIESQTEEKVALVDLRRQFDVRVQTDKTTFRIGIPDTTLTQRLGRLSSIMASVEQFREQLEFVDLALDNNVPIKLTSTKKLAFEEKGKEKEEKKSEESL